jgi:hypothetical protein
VNAITFNGSDCAHAYIGGHFSSINGAPTNNIAEISTSTGDIVPGFRTAANGEVFTLLAVKEHLLAGGDFTYINGVKDPHMASVSPVTGQDDGFLHLNISGRYDYCNASGTKCTLPSNHPMVYSQQLSHSGTLDLVEGRFTSVGGLPRQQIFMLNLATDPATVTGWTSPQWDGSGGKTYPYRCMPNEAFYIRAAAWSPTDATIYIATTGYHPVNKSAGSAPRTGLCDAVAAFPATQTPVTDQWIEYAGCDSYYSVAADSSTVYVAGHPRWADNPDGCDHAGPGAVPDPGMQGLDPATGQVKLNAGGTAKYSMARANAADMLLTSAGLWIASSNRFGSNVCNGVHDLTGICFLPYPGS